MNETSTGVSREAKMPEKEPLLDTQGKRESALLFLLNILAIPICLTLWYFFPEEKGTTAFLMGVAAIIPGGFLAFEALAILIISTTVVVETTKHWLRTGKFKIQW